MRIFTAMKMDQRHASMLKMPIPFLIQLIFLITNPLVRGSDGLTQSELRASYGQGMELK